MSSAPVHPIIVTEEFSEWVQAQPRVVEFRFPDPDTCEIAGIIVPGRYDDPETTAGVTLYANDGVVNGWAEYYYDLPVAVARLAALAECVKQESFFRDAPEDFNGVATFFLRAVQA